MIFKTFLLFICVCMRSHGKIEMNIPILEIKVSLNSENHTNEQI